MDIDIKDFIIQAATEKKFPDNTPFSALSVANVTRIASENHLPVRNIELCALENNIIPVFFQIENTTEEDIDFNYLDIILETSEGKYKSI